MDELIMLKRSIVVIVTALFLSGCAIIPKVTPVSNYAYLSGNTKNDFSLIVDFKHPLSKSKIEFVNLDTVYLGNYSSNPTRLNVTPGVHTLNVKCTIYPSEYHLAPKHKYTTTEMVNMYFKENTYYSFNGFVGNDRKCNIKVTEYDNPKSFTVFSTKSSAKSYKNKYSLKTDNKAFAQSATGSWAWSSNKPTILEAEQSALNSCKSSNSKNEDRYPCTIIDINGKMVNR